MLDEKTQTRFWKNVAVGAPTECWPWLGTQRNAKGYGHFIANRRKVVASRYALQTIVGIYRPACMLVIHATIRPAAILLIYGRGRLVRT